MASAASAAGTTTTKPPSEAKQGGEICCAIAILVLAIIGAVHLSIDLVHFSNHKPSWLCPHDPVVYTVAVAAVSGLDPAKDLHHGPSPSPSLLLLDPAFNVTLVVASPRTAERRECVDAGTTVEVSYLRPSGGVPLAAGTAPAFCVDVGERREEASVVAWGVGVRLPGLVLDSLAADMLRGGAPEFGVRITPPPYCGSGERLCICYDTVDVISCWPAKVGGAPAPCTVSKEKVSSPPVPVPRPGGGTDSASPAANLPQPTP